MKAGWEVKKLGDVCTVIAGQSPEGKFYNTSGDGLPFYQGKKEFSEKNIGKPTTWTTFVTKEAEKNDVLMSVRAPVGPINFSTEKICIGRGLAAIRASKLINKDFLFNFLLKHEAEIVGNTGAVFDSISKNQIENILIPTPPIPEQQRIVAILDQAFEGITKARANAEQNLQNGRALFESHLQSVFTQRGEVWVNCKLSDVVEFDKTQHKPNNALPYVGMEDIESDTGKFVGRKEPRKVKSSTFHFNCSHVLYGRLRPYLNKVLLPDFEGHCSTEVFPLLPSLNLDRNFLFYWLTLSSTKEKINATCTGARMPRANMNDVLAFDFSYPSLDAQNTIVENLKALSKETQRLEAIYQRKIALLDELKKSLLQQAFAGEL